MAGDAALELVAELCAADFQSPVCAPSRVEGWTGGAHGEWKRSLGETSPCVELEAT